MGQLRTFFFSEVEAVSFFLLRNWTISRISNLSLFSILKTMKISIYCKWVHTFVAKLQVQCPDHSCKVRDFLSQALDPPSPFAGKKTISLLNASYFASNKLEKLSCRCLDWLLPCVLICSAKRNIRITGNWSDGSPGEFPSYRLFASHFMKSRSYIQRLFDF